MEFTKAVLSHFIILSVQPLYLYSRWLLNSNYFRDASAVWMTLTAVTWIFIVTKITIPCLTSPLSHLPSSPGDSFPLGHSLLMRQQQPPLKMQKACDETPNKGVLALWEIFYLFPRIIVTTPEAAMDVLNTHSYDWQKPGLTKKLLNRILGNGLINVEGSVHKSMRRTVAPAFSGRVIRDYTLLFWSKALAVTDAMAREAKASVDGEVEIMGQMSRVTLDIIGAAGIGIDLNTVENNDNKLAKLYAIITSTNRGPLLPFFFINVLLPPWLIKKMYGTVYARVTNAIDELRGAIYGLIAEKKERMLSKESEQKDIIATIMRSGDFSDDYLCDQLLTFFAAGHDTTASALTWATWLLSENQDIQERLRKECHEHLSSTSVSKITADTFDAMPYLTAVCNETLRLYPTVPVTVRHAAVNTMIGDYHIPRGTYVLIAPWVLNRSTALWGEGAETFKPERWIEGPLAATGGATNPYAFSTFIHGPRSCIGQSFSRMEMKCLLAALILRFRFDPSITSPSVEPGGFITMKPKGGLRLKLHDRSLQA